MKTIHFILLLNLCFFMSACDKNKYTSIEITTPTDNQNYNGTTTVEVKAKILDDGDSIMNEELLVTMIDSTYSTTILDFKDVKFCFVYNLSQSFVAEPGKQYKIDVKARGGHGNWSDKTIMVTCN